MAGKCPEFNNRLQEILQYKRETSYKLSKVMKVDPKTVEAYLKAGSVPGVSAVVNLLSEWHDISPEWLLLGEGDMIRANDGHPTSVSGHHNAVGTGNTIKEDVNDLSSVIETLTQANSKLVDTNARLVEMLASGRQ